MDASIPAFMDVHENVFNAYLTRECPMFLADMLVRFFRISMMVFHHGGVNYNAVMIANTIAVDFFQRNHRFLARHLCLEFVYTVLHPLYSNPKFWDLLNKVNVHYFYLTMRSQMADVFCFRMGVAYGSQLLGSLHNRLSPVVFGHREEYPEERDLLLAAWNKYLEAMPDVPNPQEQDAVRASSRTRKIMLVSFRIFSMSPFVYCWRHGVNNYLASTKVYFFISGRSSRSDLASTSDCSS